MPYHENSDGEWIKPNMADYKMGCCDCGLVHRVEFGILNNQVVYRAWRDNRATAQRRRWLVKKEKLNGKHG